MIIKFDKLVRLQVDLPLGATCGEAIQKIMTATRLYHFILACDGEKIGEEDVLDQESDVYLVHQVVVCKEHVQHTRWEEPCLGGDWSVV